MSEFTELRIQHCSAVIAGIERDQRLEVVEDSNVFLNAMGTGARQLDALYHLLSGSSLGGCAHLRRAPFGASHNPDSRLPRRGISCGNAAEQRMLQQCIIE